MRPRLLLLVAALLAVAATVFVACGGEDDQDAGAVLSETFGSERTVRSGRLDLALDVRTEGGTATGPIRLRLSGPFQSTGARQLPRFDFTVDLAASGQTIRAGAVSAERGGFVRFQGQTYDIGRELFEQFRRGYAEQSRQNSDRDGVSFADLGVDPRRWLRNPRVEGSEEIGGADTTHVTGSLDVPVFLQDLNRIIERAPRQGGDRARPLSEQERRQIEQAVRNATVDVYSGEEDRILRRLHVDLGFAVPEAARERTQGVSGGQVGFDLTIAGVNEDQEIRAPTGARPLSELTQRFGGAGAAGGSAAPAPGGQGSGGGGQQPRQPGGAAAGGAEYERCINEAGADVSALQRCAELIGR
jgi:hypothetical protein